jgi:hypothetical protein
MYKNKEKSLSVAYTIMTIYVNLIEIAKLVIKD